MLHSSLTELIAARNYKEYAKGVLTNDGKIQI